MAALTKRKKVFAQIVKPDKVYSIEEAVEAIQQFPAVKFDETVEIHIDLNIDPKNSDQAVRGSVVLPHGTGKKIRIAVFCKGENLQKARAVGVELVGADDLIEKVANGFLDFDKVVATPDMMRDLSKLGKILGPRGLMPSPKAGTVTNDIEKVISELRAGRIEFRNDKQGDIHAGVGKRSFSSEQLKENIHHFIDALTHTKPSSVKGIFFKHVFLSTTMGPGLKLSI